MVVTKRENSDNSGRESHCAHKKKEKIEKMVPLVHTPLRRKKKED